MFDKRLMDNSPEYLEEGGMKIDLKNCEVTIYYDRHKNVTAVKIHQDNGLRKVTHIFKEIPEKFPFGRNI